ncbi:hypothetical protein HD806DRAFT_540352 [Xylariaceae sp. AK1471]|nr:hypothetical protein HD806DRAFT_540352 [Xylariaceae sp. AK1471]
MAYYLPILDMKPGQATYMYTPSNLPPAGFVGLAEEHPMQSYFPQEMFLELWRSNDNIPPAPALAAAAPVSDPAPNNNQPVASASEPTPTSVAPAPSPAPNAEANSNGNQEQSQNGNQDGIQDENQTENEVPVPNLAGNNDTQAASAPAPTPAAPESNPQENAANPPATPNADAEATVAIPATKYNVYHIIYYYPWAPTPKDERAEYQIIGKYENLREANERAVKEVYEKYGGLAHAGRAHLQPPNSGWIRKVAGRGTETWPNTWNVEDGRLNFHLVVSKLQYTLKGQILIVKG